jgi:hypothetical protein
MDEQQKNLKTLRENISNAQWNLCLENMRQLLQYISRNDTLKIVLDMVKRFLIEILNNNLNNETIVYIAQNLNFTTIDDIQEQMEKINQLFKNKYSEPGVNNFRTAIKQLLELSEFNYPSDDYINTVVNIISGLLLAITLFDWGSRKPDLWQKWFLQKSEDDVFILARYYVNDTKVIELNRIIWMQLANDIELTLQSK